MQRHFLFKILVAGDASVGKTSLLRRYVDDMFDESTIMTVGVDFFLKQVELDTGIGCSLQLWDLGGQESFRTLRKLYLEGANGALLIYDTTQKSTFEKLHDWIKDFREARGNEPVLLIGNKIDLENNIKISDAEAKEFAENYHVKFLSTSAKTGSNVEEAFKQISLTIVKKSLSK